MSKNRIQIETLKRPEFKQVPEGYFEALPDQIWSKIQGAQMAPTAIIVPLWKRWSTWSISVAASVILVVSGVFYNQKLEKDRELALINEIPKHEVMQFVANESYDLDDLYQVHTLQNNEVDTIIDENINDGLNSNHLDQLEDELY